MCDYDNIKSIFHHFYGKYTDFKGYITKFSTAPPFRYSLKESYVNYIRSILPKEISQFNDLSNLLSKMIAEQLDITSDIEKGKESLRTVKNNIINYRPNIIKQNIENNNHPSIIVNSINSFTIFLDLLFRFNIDFSNLREQINKDSLKKDFLNSVGESWKLSSFVIIDKNKAIRFIDNVYKTTYNPVLSNNFNQINFSYYETIIQGIDSVIERINKSKIFTNDIIIKA